MPFRVLVVRGVPMSFRVLVVRGVPLSFRVWWCVVCPCFPLVGGLLFGSRVGCGTSCLGDSDDDDTWEVYTELVLIFC